MSESEFKKIRLHLRLLTVCVLVLIALLAANLVHRNFNPKSTSFPKVQIVQGKPGKDAIVNYQAIDQHIDAKVASLPKPQNGANGQSIRGPQGVRGITGKTGSPGKAGPQGDPGTAGREIELRYNPVKHETEWHYSGDLSWNILFMDCQILGTC